MPYPGETIADKLKTVEKSDFNTIENAWEAHKARNQVVHAGSDYQLTEREAKRIIDLYRSVFEEFFFV
jgi:transposase